MAMVALPAGLFYFLLWFSYVDHWPDYCKLFYYMFCYLIFNSLLTVSPSGLPLLPSFRPSSY